MTRLDFGDEVDCLALVLVYNLGVDLSCADIAVAEELGDGVEVCSVGQCEGCEGVACNRYATQFADKSLK